jgi:hypothetical protein
MMYRNINSSITDEQNMSAYETTRHWNVVLVTIICFIGVFVNAIAFYIFCSKKLRSNSVNIYLMFLVASDGLFLCIHFSEDTLRTLNDMINGNPIGITSDSENNPVPPAIEGIISYLIISDLTTWTCRIVQYIRYVLRFYSAYIVVLFTLLRSIAVHSPFWLMRFNSTQLTYRILINLLIVSLVINIWVPFLFVLRSSDTPGNMYCDVDEKTSEIYFSLTIGYIIIIMFVPFILIFTSNVIIVISLYKARNKRGSLLSTNLDRKDLSRSSDTNSIRSEMYRPNFKSQKTTRTETKVVVSNFKIVLNFKFLIVLYFV